MKKNSFMILIEVIAVAVSWLMLRFGYWWGTPMIGLLIGLFLRSAHMSFILSFCVGGLSWGLPLVVLTLNAPLESTADAIANTINLSSAYGMLIIVITIGLGCALGGVGAWVGVAIRKVTYPRNAF